MLAFGMVFPEVKLNIYTKNNAVEVPVTENRIATTSVSPNFIRHITFDVGGTELENNIKAGQSIGILPPGADAKGKPHALRLYSVSSPSFGEYGNGRYYSTTVKRVIYEDKNSLGLCLGICSNYLSSRKPGDTVLMTGPSGKRFLLPENKADFNYVFVAAGTGIAPFRGMIMELIQQKTSINITLIFGCAYRTDVLYEVFFKELATINPNFNYLISISRENPRPDGTKHYVQYQFVDNASLLNPILKQENTLVYICGLKGMEYDIYQTLALHGYFDYIQLKPGIDTNPENWAWDDIKRNVKPSERMFVETY